MTWLLNKFPWLAAWKLILISFFIGVALGAFLVWKYSSCDSEIEKAKKAQLEACQENINITQEIENAVAKETVNDKRRIDELNRLLRDTKLYIATNTVPASESRGSGRDKTCGIGIRSDWFTSYVHDFKSCQNTVVVCKKWIAAKLEQNGEPIPNGLLD